MKEQIIKLIKEAQFSVEFNQREMVKYALNLELTPDSDWDRLMLATCEKNASQAQYRLLRLTEKLAELNSKTLPESNGITRFEVIDSTGRILSQNGVNVQLSYQDNGQTLKVFLS